MAAPQRAEVWRTGAQQATHYRMVPAVKDAFGDAVLAADKADDKQAAANAAAQVPPEMTGAADLARFGAWSIGARRRAPVDAREAARGLAAVPAGRVVVELALGLDLDRRPALGLRAVPLRPLAAA